MHNRKITILETPPETKSAGRVAGATLPVSNSFLGRARAWYGLHSFSERLTQAEQEAKAKAAKAASKASVVSAQSR